MNRNWSNQKANPALKTKAGNKHKKHTFHLFFVLNCFKICKDPFFQNQIADTSLTTHDKPNIRSEIANVREAVESCYSSEHALLRAFKEEKRRRKVLEAKLEDFQTKVSKIAFYQDQTNNKKLKKKIFGEPAQMVTRTL